MRFQYLRFAAAVTGGLFLVHCAAKEADTGEDTMPIDTATGTSTATMPTMTGTGTMAPPATTPSVTTPTPTMTMTAMPTMTMTTTVMPTMTMTTAMPTMTMTAMPTMTMTAPSMSASGDDMLPAGSGGMMDMPAGSSSTPEMGAGGDAGGGTTPGGGEFVLTSENLEDGAEMPDAYTCAGMPSFGTGPMPQLAWGEPPEGTLSFALAFVDTKLLGEQGDDSQFANHWAMWNIGADIREISEGLVDNAKLTALGGATQTGGGFLGPCPSLMGTATDTYSFDLYALNVAELSVQGMNVYQARQAMEAAMIEKISLTASSDAAPGTAVQ